MFKVEEDYFKFRIKLNSQSDIKKKRKVSHKKAKRIYILFFRKLT